ncbi:MAG: hypothetical protein EOO39_07605 [Cytophagaceae bacterium]|nr:MAG: hypothetical protein EOO39_07605 [Cytophagaceae bacterium]
MDCILYRERPVYFDAPIEARTRRYVQVHPIFELVYPILNTGLGVALSFGHQSAKRYAQHVIHLFSGPASEGRICLHCPSASYVALMLNWFSVS